MPLKAGFNMITPTFKDTSSTQATYDIQNIKLSDDASSYGLGGEQIQLVDTEGNVAATYTWLNKDVTGTVDAWCDDSATPVTVSIESGEGFLLYTEGEGVVELPSSL